MCRRNSRQAHRPGRRPPHAPNSSPDAFHQVLTGVTVLTRSDTCADVEITQVYFDTIGEHELVRYLASQEPLDKAGAYGIQGYAARWIPKIEGCYFNVVGLPIARTIALLSEAAAKLRAPIPGL